MAIKVTNIDKLRHLDEQEKKILRALVTNPRMSDNKVSREVGIPLKTVNRKRSKLEKDGIITYYLSVDNIKTGSFSSSAMCSIIFRYGITRKGFLDVFDKTGYTSHEIKHIKSASLGESQGRLALILIIESRVQDDILEIINSVIIPKLDSMLGVGSVHKTEVVYLHAELSILHNYLPLHNLDSGLIKKGWPQDRIFIS